MIKPALIGLAAAVVTALLIAGAIEDRADAHMGATGVIKERMDLMDTFAAAMKTIKAGVTAKPEMKRAAIATAARKIAELSDRLPILFPKGSTQMPSEARPEIWSDWDKFVQAGEATKAEAAKLADLAGKADRRAVLGQFARMARTCGACHEGFRKPKK